MANDAPQYCIGFAVSEDGESVLLLLKNRPKILAGKWMGVAGHVEPGEHPHAAMVREAKEEADIDVPEWEFMKIIENPETPGAEISTYVARTDLSKARTMTDETVVVFKWEALASLDLSNATLEVLEQVKKFAQGVPGAASRPAP